VKIFVGFGMVVASAVIISGCSTSGKSTSASNSQPLQTTQSVQSGVVIKLREISLHDDRAPLVTRTETQGRSLAQVGGAILGAMTDESTDDHTVRADSQEITVRFDNGAIRVVTQPGIEKLQLNQRVKVVNATQSTQVVPF
jgi:outer membrane lipoprotein SlyB